MNTYSINVTRGQEFSVRDELEELGLHPWVPMRLCKKFVKQTGKVKWYDAPYAEKLIFCVIPAIYWRDVRKIKHVIGKPMELSRLDVQGVPAADIRRADGTVSHRAARPGLTQFRDAVQAEYDDMLRCKANGEYTCQFKPGQALEILAGVFEGKGEFKEVIQRAHDQYAKLRVEVEMMGGKVRVDVDPDKVRAVG